MSRHKLIKSLDIHDELGSFDGEESYDYDSNPGEELSEEDLGFSENLRIGTIAVRAELPTSTGHITDKQIQESLWHTYYDIDRSVNYLINAYCDKPKLSNKAAAKELQGLSFHDFSDEYAARQESGCQDVREIRPHVLKHFSHAKFFEETPWLNVPTELKATFIAPEFQRGGLLGGSGEPPKMSKLQTLAAARKKMAQERQSSIGLDSEHSVNSSHSGQHGDSLRSDNLSVSSQKLSRSFPIRRRKASNPDEQSLDPVKIIGPKPEVLPTCNNILVDQAKPSEFANTMFSSIPLEHPRQNFTISFATELSPATDPFSGPSPDDIVMAAQSKAAAANSGQNKIRPKTKKDKKPDQLIKSTELLKIDDPLKAKYKKLDILKECENQPVKNAANFLVIGHVDAGKSTLMGRLLLDLGVVDQRTIDRYKKEAGTIGKSSFAMAWVLDQGSEERARGVTIDIAMKKFETAKTSFTILDAPGHRDFIPNMIAGASQADFAVLVIDASTGSFESGLRGQTKEHAFIVRSMGVQRMIIAVNKLDTIQWSQERFAEIENQLFGFLSTAGFQSKNISFVPCSGLVGDNVVRKSTDPAASWYTGLTLVETLENFEPITRALTKPLRLPVSDIFHGGAQNLLSISGRIEAGNLQISDALLAQPSGHTFVVKSIEHDHEAVDWAVAGQNITIQLSGNEEQHLKIGNVLCSPSSPIQNVNGFTAKVIAFECLLPMPVDVHRGRLHTTGRLKEIIGALNKTTGIIIGGKKPRVVKPGTVARITVELDHVVPLEAPERIVLRSGGVTVATGIME